MSRETVTSRFQTAGVVRTLNRHRRRTFSAWTISFLRNRDRRRSTQLWLGVLYRIGTINLTTRGRATARFARKRCSVPCCCTRPQVVVYALAFSPDGGTLASGTTTGALVARGGRRVRPLCEKGEKTQRSHPSRTCGLRAWPSGTLRVARLQLQRGMFSPPNAAPRQSLAMLDAKTMRGRATGQRGRAGRGVVGTGRPDNPRAFFREPNGVRAGGGVPGEETRGVATGHKKVSVWRHRPQSPSNFRRPPTIPHRTFPRRHLLAACRLELKSTNIRQEARARVLKGTRGCGQVGAFRRTVCGGDGESATRRCGCGTWAKGRSDRFPVAMARVYSLAYAPDGSAPRRGETGARSWCGNAD